MAPNANALLEAPIIELDIIDSTNNYAMHLIDADTAQPGLTIITKEQSKGKGQRGRTWVDTPGYSLLMSIITVPLYGLSEQFIFNANVAISIANILQKLYELWDVKIKWPNDIIVNDKKAGGILIENILRGNQWIYSIIGFGLNVKQEAFLELPYATSLKIESGKDFNMVALRDELRANILEYASKKLPAKETLQQYNEYLYRRGQEQTFFDESGEWNAIVVGAEANGTLMAQLADASIVHYTHGTVNWKWK